MAIYYPYYQASLPPCRIGGPKYFLMIIVQGHLVNEEKKKHKIHGLSTLPEGRDNFVGYKNHMLVIQVALNSSRNACSYH